MAKAATLEELLRLRPEQMQISHPNLERDWEAHLAWLIDNRPEWTAEMFQKDRKKLRDRLLLTTQTAALSRAIHRTRGDLDPDQIEEIIYNQIVAPPEGLGEDPPEEMPEEMQRKIQAWSDWLHDPTM